MNQEGTGNRMNEITECTFEATDVSKSNSIQALVTIHPIIVDGLEAIIMQELTKILRRIYQVLSQPNYYLSKFGISSKRISGPHLMKLKLLGIVGSDVKVCSYILKSEAFIIFKSFNSGPECKYFKMINWERPYNLDVSIPTNRRYTEAPDLGLPISSKLMRESINYNILLHFIHETESIVFLKYFVPKIVAITKGEYNTQQVEYEIKCHCQVKEAPSIRVMRYIYYFYPPIESSFEDNYISIEHAVDILLIHNISIDTSKSFLQDERAIRILDPIRIFSNGPILNNDIIDFFSQCCPDHMKTEIYNFHSNEVSPEKEFAEEFSTNFCKIPVYDIDGTNVIALPDINKVIRLASKYSSEMSGIRGAQQRQVNYYLNKLNCKKGKFNFMQLKAVKENGTDVGNATYCTYVMKCDAEKILNIFGSIGNCDKDVLKSTLWSEPIEIARNTGDDIPENYMTSSSFIDDRSFEAVKEVSRGYDDDKVILYKKLYKRKAEEVKLLRSKYRRKIRLLKDRLGVCEIAPHLLPTQVLNEDNNA